MCFNIITIIKYILTKISSFEKNLTKIGARIISLASKQYSTGEKRMMFK